MLVRVQPPRRRSFERPILWCDEIISRKHILVAKSRGSKWWEAINNAGVAQRLVHQFAILGMWFRLPSSAPFWNHIEQLVNFNVIPVHPMR